MFERSGRGALTNSNRVSKSLYSFPDFLLNKYSDYYKIFKI